METKLQKQLMLAKTIIKGSLYVTLKNVWCNSLNWYGAIIRSVKQWTSSGETLEFSLMLGKRPEEMLRFKIAVEDREMYEAATFRK